MGLVHESFWKWRVKFLIPAVVILLMMISVMRRYILPLVFGLFVLIVSVRPSSAVTWEDVIIAWAAQPTESGCINFVTKYSQNGQTGFQLWKRCGGSSVQGFYKQYYNGSTVNSTNRIAFTCTGVGSTVWTSAGWMIGSRWQEQHYCDGSTVTTSPEAYAPATGIRVITTQPCLDATYGNGSICAQSDVLIADFYPIVDECEYVGISAETPLGWTTPLYSSLVPDNGNYNVCNQCIPAGLMPDDDNPSHNTPTVDDPYGPRYRCYWKDVTGDPGATSDGYVPPSSGGGAVGESGGQRPYDVGSSSETTTESVTSGGQTETTSTTTTTTTQSNGSTSTTTTREIVNCVDLNADGISDISGRKCDEVISETSTTSPSAGSFDVTKPGSYSNSALPEVGDFGTLFSEFFADVQGTQLFSTFSLSGLAPSGSGSSSYSLDFGNYGTHDFNLANYSTALNIIKGFMLLLASYLAVRVVVLKR